MAKHEVWELRQMQSLPLAAKIRMTQRRIRDWYDYWNGQVYISFSGGKDSTVLKHIIDQMYDDVPAVFVNTGLEYPEIQKFAMSQKNVVTVRPKMRFDEVLVKYGYPVISKDTSKRIKDGRAAIRNGNESSYALRQLRGDYMTPDGRKSPYNMEKWEYLLDAPFEISSQCCDVMKKRPIHKYERETGRKPFIGTMATESRQRQSAWMKNGCNAFDVKKPRSQPMSFWTEPNRFQRLKETHPRQYEYCISGGEMVDGKWQPSKEGLGLCKVLDYIGVNYK